MNQLLQRSFWTTLPLFFFSFVDSRTGTSPVFGLFLHRKYFPPSQYDCNLALGSALKSPPRQHARSQLCLSLVLLCPTRYVTASAQKKIERLENASVWKRHRARPACLSARLLLRDNALTSKHKHMPKPRNFFFKIQITQSSQKLLNNLQSSGETRKRFYYSPVVILTSRYTLLVGNHIGRLQKLGFQFST